MADLKKPYDSINTLEEEDDDSKSKYSHTSHSKLFYVAILVLALGAKSYQPLAIAAAKNDSGKYDFDVSSLLILSEIVKLNICVIILFVQYSMETKNSVQHAMTNIDLTTTLHFIIPSACWALSNTLAFKSLMYINPGLFHVFGNLRIIVAGILYRIFMGRK